MTAPTLDRLARPSGTFAMVAMDQRESLRAMFAEEGHPSDDATLTAFKLEVADVLAPLASAFLIDRHYAYADLVRERPLPSSCGLILAADALTHMPGGVVEDTELDLAVDPGHARSDGAVALKLLVIWKRDGQEARREEMTHRFVALCRDAGLLSVLEPVAVPAPGQTDFDLDAAILDAASVLGPSGPSLYKAQVPSRGRGSMSELVAACEKLDGRLSRPWVVLSNGVEAADFPAAVEAACRAGASGMLAGRALWRDAIATPDPAAALRARSADRLRRLGETVDRYGRPWTEAG
ncbi:sulfofructosephosphate aldolase [Actinoallomurus oryzae]|uniref:Sulfofructosephosphate aldolase n=1 Tax=Actinoallomurus oryzae TaxID=502180 RepID=A0ABP8PX93_9ACTN